MDKDAKQWVWVQTEDEQVRVAQLKLRTRCARRRKIGHGVAECSEKQ